MHRRVKIIVYTFLFLFVFIGMSGQAQETGHQKWDLVLKTYVDPDGAVDYLRLKENEGSLQTYLDLLSKNTPDVSWSRQEQLAYWINAYNAFTVKLILDHYPVKSIRDIDRPWEQKFIRLGNGNYSLDHIEHEIIRKEFAEPRIHFALVCAAVSCPPLLNEAYTAEKLDEQLDRRAREFINDPEKNKISPSNIRISQIFNWFKDDFTKDGSLISYLNRYSETKIRADAEVEFMEYDWGLNGE